MKIRRYFPSYLLPVIALMGFPLAVFSNGPESPWDYIPPTAICEDQLNVSLTSVGTAIVYAQSFDEGSYDNYCLAGVKVRRMDEPNAPFTNAVVFDCDDIGQLVSVELQARDCAGNTNSCWTNVWVEDKLPPHIHCPYDKTIACDELNDWYAMGQATATDNCGVADISYSDSDNTGSCGTGYITRTWTATDIYGYSSSCTQTIHVVDNTPVVVLFPPDTTFHDCITANDLDPEDLPPPYDQPTVLYEDCELMAFSHEDWVFTAAPNSCVKIIRRWKVINWCTYQYGGDQGIWEDNQILKIQDNTPPEITCPDDVVKAVNANCTATVTMPPLASVDDCLSDVEIRIYGDLGEGDIFTNVPIGEYEMTYVAKDGCLNTSSCDIRVTVVDATPPGVVCYSGLSFPLMSNGEAMLWASDVEVGSSYDNCTPYDKLIFRLGPEPAPGQTSPPDEDFLTFTCADTGSNTVALWIGDEAGNWDYCLSEAIVQDNQNICGPTVPPLAQAQISGFIFDEQGDKIPDVRVNIDSSATGPYEAYTDSLGWYAFDSMPVGASYTLRPEKLSAPLDGVTTIDLILLAMHVMGVDSLDSPYQYIAADIDLSGVVDMADLEWLHRMLLGLEPAFPVNLTWRFVPRSYTFPDPDPLSVDFPEEITIDGLSGPADTAHFTGIKLGDLDASLNQPDSLQMRSVAPAFAVQAQDRFLQAGEETEVALSAQNHDAILGLLLRFQHDGLLLEEARFGPLGGTGEYRAGTQTSAISWAREQSRLLEPGEQLITLRFKADRDGLLSEMLSLEQSAQAFRASAGIEEAPVELHFTSSAKAFRLLSAYPNPFRDKAYLRIEIPGSEKLRLSVWENRGALVYRSVWDMEAGLHELPVNAADLGGPGTYLFRLESESGVASGRLVLMPGQ
ncbi:MAG: HYR domain-containing protein [Lewinellaceae bacterium]|nr:HYR domain-containing protein [Lewinellaceae bacterium]